ncbi:MAG: cache domain-containing protein [Desulfobulbus sp.]|nr:cache domain-containing protein [Desulfobulbus sp.]
MAFLAVGLVGSLWISQEYSKFEDEAEHLRSIFLDQQKTLIRQEVNRVVDYIQYQRSTTETALKATIKDRVDQAWTIANTLYKTYQGKKSSIEIQTMIRETLRGVRFDQERGYFFIYDMQGTNILLPFSPELEGRNLLDLRDSEGLYTIRRFIALMQQQNQGYLRWHWYKPGETTRMSEKIGYSRVFAPFNWWIGTGAYIEDVERKIQAQTLARINTIRYAKDGYIFVYDFKANTLAHYKPENLGVNQWEFRDSNGVPVLQELIRGCRQEKGIFLDYVGTIRPATGLPAPKLAYARAIAPWQWMVGTGVYMDEINPVIAEKRAALGTKIRRDLGVIAIILLFSLVGVAFVSRLITARIIANIQGFAAFFERAASGNEQIDDQSVHFTEFQQLAQAANQMVIQRMEAEEAVAELQEQLIRSRKMEALGVLAGGVAHDLNNVLSAVVGYPDMLLASLSKDHPQRRAIEAIRDSGLKAAEIVQDLLTLARRGVIQPVVVDLNHLIRTYFTTPEWIRTQIENPQIIIATDLAPDLLHIKGSRVHLQKTVMNLIVNAAEAQPTGGKISVLTANCYLDKPLSGYDQIREGNYVLLQVKDQGIGIAQKDLERIFEPFFSKKNLGRSGTGLGMTVVWGTVEDHDGYINVSSAEGQGAEFSLYFPATQELITAQPDADLPLSRGTGQRLLVVDDLEEQRLLAANMLKNLGYEVVTASGGEQALERLSEQPFELVLLDMIMHPGIDGLETYQRILKLHPGQRAILVSGYAQTERVSKAMALGAQSYLKKPYTLAGLARAVAEVLG